MGKYLLNPRNAIRRYFISFVLPCRREKLATIAIRPFSRYLSEILCFPAKIAPGSRVSPRKSFHLTEITKPNGTLVTVADSVGSLSRLTP